MSELEWRHVRGWERHTFSYPADTRPWTKNGKPPAAIKLPAALKPPAVLPTAGLDDEAAWRYVLRIVLLPEAVARDRMYSDKDLQKVTGRVRKDVDAMARYVAGLLARHDAKVRATEGLMKHGVRCGNCHATTGLTADCPICGRETFSGVGVRAVLVPPVLSLPATVRALLPPRPAIDASSFEVNKPPKRRT